ncbi:hypothetical protein ACRE_062290 [Hapsidospora chrysogenum ATCC 11550]|uniref:DUF7735 domain-containing protein n=1 Tax=Hapsidospora chrysogenum (strain ATCC 11550 / CBS 779.69 / DSM 880 / IAM 14645 / JCM 23072 / IMI 49137) TaxID=857340 RepID=A0A086T0Y0_HAPC1|nr:hypothetical protein ACRE_062290 [Hapsidospora chrysogenum ATCC 11550]
MRITLHLAALAAAITTTAANALDNHDDPMIFPQVREALAHEPRQTSDGGSPWDIGGLSPSCTKALLSVFRSLPMPPAELASAVLGGQGGAGAGGGHHDPCASLTVPSTLSSEYSSYSTELSSWYEGHSQSVSSALSDCPDLSEVASRLPVCATSYLGPAQTGNGTGTTTPASNTATATTTTTATTTSTTKSDTTRTDTAAATTTTTDAAMRETARAVAGLVVAWVVAVVAL